MSTPPASPRMVEVSGAEALWLLEGSSLGRLVVRTPAPAAAVPATATYHVDGIRTVAGTGWTVTAAGLAEVITDPDEAALPHCLKGMGGAPIRRTLPGWTHDA